MLSHSIDKMDSITQFLTQALNTAGGESNIASIFLAFGVAYLGGILSSLTPCIYPMIPITISVVGGLAPGGKRGREVAVKSLFYVSGMSVIYAFLGVLAGLTGQIFGSFTQTTYWYLGIGIVMTFAGLVMLDVIPFDPAAWWDRWRRRNHHKVVPQEIAAHKKTATHFGAFVLGATSGFIAAPCTTPVLAVILAYIAKTQSIGWGFLLMLFFSWGLGTILMLIAFFTGALRFLPKSGAWMSKVKIASGLILIAFAEYLIYLAGKSGGG